MTQARPTLQPEYSWRPVVEQYATLLDHLRALLDLIGDRRMNPDVARAMTAELRNDIARTGRFMQAHAEVARLIAEDAVAPSLLIRD